MNQIQRKAANKGLDILPFALVAGGGYWLYKKLFGSSNANQEAYDKGQADMFNKTTVTPNQKNTDVSMTAWSTLHNAILKGDSAALFAALQQYQGTDASAWISTDSAYTTAYGTNMEADVQKYLTPKDYQRFLYWTGGNFTDDDGSGNPFSVNGLPSYYMGLLDGIDE